MKRPNLLVLLCLVAVVACQKKPKPKAQTPDKPTAQTPAPTPTPTRKTLTAEDLKVGLRLEPTTHTLKSGDREIRFSVKAPSGLFKRVPMKDYKGNPFTHIIKYAIPGYSNQQFVVFEFSRFTDIELKQRVLLYHRNQGERVHTSTTLPKNAVGVIAALRQTKPKKPIFIGHFLFNTKRDGVDLHCQFRITTMVYETFGKQITDICESITIQ